MVISGGNFRPDALKAKEVVSLLLDDEEIEMKCKLLFAFLFILLFCSKFFTLYLKTDRQKNEERKALLKEEALRSEKEKERKRKLLPVSGNKVSYFTKIEVLN